MGIAVNFPRVQRHPQTHPLRLAARSVVPADSGHKRGWEAGNQASLRYIRRNQDECTVAAVLDLAVFPDDPALPEGIRQRPVQSFSDRKLVQVGPGSIAEAFHVNHHDRTVNWKLLTHSASPLIGSLGCLSGSTHHTLVKGLRVQ